MSSVGDYFFECPYCNQKTTLGKENPIKLGQPKILLNKNGRPVVEVVCGKTECGKSSYIDMITQKIKKIDE